MKETLEQTKSSNQPTNFFASHQLIIGLSLLFFGAASLSLIMPNIWNSEGQWQGYYILMTQWILTVPMLLLMTLVGTLILCFYIGRNLQNQTGDSKKYVAMLLTAMGFTYQVIGTWPLWNQAYPWPWQKEIANYGNPLVIPLFAGSLIALFVGGASLYKFSKINQEKSSEFDSALV